MTTETLNQNQTATNKEQFMNDEAVDYTRNITISAGVTAFEEQVVPEPAANAADFDLANWEQKVNAAMGTNDKFNLWAEGVDHSEQAFANYQAALLAVLQNIYKFFYDTKDMPKECRSSINDAIKQKLGAKVAKRAGSLQNQLVKIAWLQHEENADETQRRALQKRTSTYANALLNAWTPGEIVEGVTDMNGRILPDMFAQVVKESGGISVFSRKSREDLKREAELQAVLNEAGFETEGALNAHSVKQCLLAGEFTDDTVELSSALNLSVKLPAYDLSDALARAVDIDDGDVALVLVSNKGGTKVARSVVTADDNSTLLEDALLLERSRLQKELKEAVEAELPQRKENEGVGKKRKMYVNGVAFTDTELVRLENFAMKAAQMGFGGDLTKAMNAMLDSHCENKVRHDTIE